MFERPLLLSLLIAAPLAAAPGWFAMAAGRRLYGALSLALRLATFAALVLMLAGIRLPERVAANRMAVVVAIDQSRSIAPDQRAWMARRLAEIRRSMSLRDRLAVVAFGRDARLAAPLGDPRLAAPDNAGIDPNATDIAGAITTAEGVFAPADEKRLVLLTDGDETEGQAADELPAMSEEGVRIFTAAPPPPAVARVAVTDFKAPGVVRAQTSFALGLDIESEAPKPAEAAINLSIGDQPVGSQKVVLAPGINRFKLPYKADRPGAYLMKAEIRVQPPLDAINPSAETAVSVISPPHVLVVGLNPPESLLAALRMRNYDVKMAGPHGLPSRPGDYLAYQAVIIANAPAETLDEGAQRALSHYVADFGGGLVVTGDTLRDWKFHGGTLEKILPITFEPQPPPPSREPIAVYLLIDRSNSMSYNSRYPAVRDGERIRYAKEAAIALLNQLDDTDYGGVIAFDSEPYVLGHLRPLGEDRDELEGRVQRLEPGGGTDFKDALEIAEREIIGSGLSVREVILLTDGDTNRQYHDHDQIMADYAKYGIPVSTIRIGPDLENLRLLRDFAHATGGVFYRVEDITKLPQLLVHLTHEAENFKLRERSQIALGDRSSILNGISLREIPPIDFFAVTQAKEGAEVPLMVRRGPRSTPLLAIWQYELGRAAIFSADPDSMGSLPWIRWDRYSQFWSQLISWVARDGDSGPFSMTVDSSGGALEIEARKADSVPVGNLFCRITGAGRAADIAMTQVGASLYHGESAPLPRGKYNLALMIKAGDTERVLLRREIAVPGSQAADSAEMRLRPANEPLLREIAQATGGGFDAPVSAILRHRGATVIIHHSLDWILLPLAILMLLSEVFIRRRYLGD
jgi:Mg-chelatase subunit ChlD